MRLHLLPLLFAAAIAFGAPSTRAAVVDGASFPPPPPLAAVRPVNETFFGSTVSDRYRYLEERGDPSTQRFLAAQETYARKVFDALKSRRDPIYERLVEIAQSRVSMGHVIRVHNDYLVVAAGGIVIRGIEPGSPWRYLLQLGQFASIRGKPLSVDFEYPSPNGRYLAFGTSEDGREESTIHIVEIKTGELLPDEISRARFAQISWQPDGHAFYYVRLQPFVAGAPRSTEYQKAICRLHILGSPPDEDPAVFGYGVDPAITVDPNDLASVALFDRYAIGEIIHGVKNELTLYVTTKAALLAGHPQWTKLFDVDDGVTHLTVAGDRLYVVTHGDGANARLAMMRLDTLGRRDLIDIIPASDVMVEDVDVGPGSLYVLSRHGGFGRLERFPLAADGAITGPAKVIALPSNLAVQTLTITPPDGGMIVGVTSWTEPLNDLDISQAGEITDPHLRPPPTIETTPYHASEVFATSADGTSIPLSIITAYDTALNRSHPTLLYGYGAYGIADDPSFESSRTLWIERGGVIAICHMRGGGWYGERWHRAGMLANKQRTIDDFVACAHYLIDHHYTSPAHLGIEGASAGGIPVGGAITQHPELFAAAVDLFPVSDSLRTEYGPGGPMNVPEFGSVATRNGFRTLMATDAYQHVRDGTAYPAVLLVGGKNDPRVEFWQPAKLAARLQAATSSQRPILFELQDSGHGSASGLQQLDLSADIYTFLFWQLGESGFSGFSTRIFHR